ncbi:MULTISPECIES: hypothetical protein [unclassified Kribbella]|uniref:hypothetical protein n=1 Tax=unclassified Kribbella TaxID=2644121 RepID=UPI00301748FD
MSESAEDSLQEAGTALRRVVEILRRRPADDVAAKALVAEFHELRILMSTAALLVSSFGLARYDGLDEADADLALASDDLSRAAGHLTAARQKLDVLP